jgi:ribosome biogenesis protein ENP2
MHGYFVSQKLYEEASLISNPDVWQEQRSKTIQARIDKERESRIRGRKKTQVKVNRKLAEKILEREEQSARKKAKRVIANGGDEEMELTQTMISNDDDEESEEKETKTGLLTDPRFSKLFEDEEFQIDEHSRDFQLLNASTKVEAKLPKGLTAVEEEELDQDRKSGSSDDEDSSPSEAEAVDLDKFAGKGKGKQDDRNSGSSRTQKPNRPKMVVTSSTVRRPGPSKDKSFGSRAATLKGTSKDRSSTGKAMLVGEREVTFTPAKKESERPIEEAVQTKPRKKDRRSASGNVFRGM